METLKLKLGPLARRGVRWFERRTRLAPGRYGELLERYSQLKPRRMLEIGVWRGDRSEQFVRLNEKLEHYVGFDLFEEMTDERHDLESMGDCHAQPMATVRARIEAARRSQVAIELIKGDTMKSLPNFVTKTSLRYDFAFIDGGHSLETVENDWNWVQQLLAPGGLCIFDDYYLDRVDAGARHLIDHLDPEEWDRQFFHRVDASKFGHYITMVGVTARRG